MFIIELMSIFMRYLFNKNLNTLSDLVTNDNIAMNAFINLKSNSLLQKKHQYRFLYVFM